MAHIVLHVEEIRAEYRLLRLLKLLLDLKGNTLELRSTKRENLPGPLKLHPVLEYQGRCLSGEIAILQYVARMEGYYPHIDPWEVYLTESLISEVFDLWSLVQEDSVDTALSFLPQIEKRLSPGSRFFGGKVPSIADIVLFDFLRRNCGGDRRKMLPPRLATFVTSCENTFLAAV